MALNPEKFEHLKILLLNKLQNTDIKNPIQGKKLCSELNINSRTFKSLLRDIRLDYPIVAKETNGGGYWLAHTDAEIVDYINMLERHKVGYDDTISKMTKLLI